MLLTGYVAISHIFENQTVINMVIASLSGFCAAVDVWLIICYIRLFVSRIPLLQNIKLKTTLSLGIGGVYNTFYVFLSLMTGFLVKSSWYLVYALYHLVFAIAKLFMGSMIHSQEEKNWSHYRLVAYFLLASALVFHVLVIYVSSQADNLAPKYPMFIYIIALSTMVNAISSFYNLFKYRKEKNPHYRATKNISFASSLFSLFFLQTMMMKQFGQNDGPAYFRLMTIILGTIVFLLLFGLSCYMIWNSYHHTRKNQSSQN